jgi:hypothetical protein
VRNERARPYKRAGGHKRTRGEHYSRRQHDVQGRREPFELEDAEPIILLKPLVHEITTNIETESTKPEAAVEMEPAVEYHLPTEPVPIGESKRGNSRRSKKYTDRVHYMKQRDKS